MMIFNNTCNKLFNLEELTLYNPCKLININLYKLSNLYKLKKIIIYGYHEITDFGISQLPANIENLSLIFCFSITNKMISRFTNLKKLNIRFCPNVCGDNTFVINSNKLEKLSFITNDYITDNFFKSIASCDNLKKLSVNYCFSITPNSLQIILKSFTKLKKIYLSDIININLDDASNILSNMKIKNIFISSIFWKICKLKSDQQYKIIFT